MNEKNKFQTKVAFLSVLIVSFFLAIPVVDIYDNYFVVEFGGFSAFILGFVVALEISTGFVYGLFYKIWYKSILILLLIPYLYYLYDVFVHNMDKHELVKETYISIISVISAYLLGFVINKLYNYFTNVRKEYKQIPKNN